MVMIAMRLEWGSVFVRDQCLVHDFLSREFREGLPMALLYADD